MPVRFEQRRNHQLQSWATAIQAYLGAGEPQYPYEAPFWQRPALQNRSQINSNRTVAEYHWDTLHTLHEALQTADHARVLPAVGPYMSALVAVATASTYPDHEGGTLASYNHRHFLLNMVTQMGRYDVWRSAATSGLYSETMRGLTKGLGEVAQRHMDWENPPSRLPTPEQLRHAGSLRNLFRQGSDTRALAATAVLDPRTREPTRDWHASVSNYLSRRNELTEALSGNAEFPLDKALTNYTGTAVKISQALCESPRLANEQSISAYDFVLTAMEAAKRIDCLQQSMGQNSDARETR